MPEADLSFFFGNVKSGNSFILNPRWPCINAFARSAIDWRGGSITELLFCVYAVILAERPPSAASSGEPVVDEIPIAGSRPAATFNRAVAPPRG